MKGHQVVVKGHQEVEGFGCIIVVRGEDVAEAFSRVCSLVSAGIAHAPTGREEAVGHAGGIDGDDGGGVGGAGAAQCKHPAGCGAG